jgi:hypothetical protein
LGKNKLVFNCKKMMVPFPKKCFLGTGSRQFLGLTTIWDSTEDLGPMIFLRENGLTFLLRLK